jgi:hypothetical protein
MRLKAGLDLLNPLMGLNNSYTICLVNKMNFNYFLFIIKMETYYLFYSFKKLN